MMKIIAAAAFVAAPRQPAHAQAIVGRSRRSLNGAFNGNELLYLLRLNNTTNNLLIPSGIKPPVVDHLAC